MCGIGMGAELLFAWPRAEIRFMEAETAATVLCPKGQHDDEEARRAFAAEIAADIRPYGAAGSLYVDEIIHPNATRDVLAAALEDMAARPFHPGADRVLASYPPAWCPGTPSRTGPRGRPPGDPRRRPRTDPFTALRWPPRRCGRAT